MRLAVIGCGYLGATHAACMAELGFEVVGLEADPQRLAKLRQGVVPFFEPGLADLLARHVASGRLRFTDSPEEAAQAADVHFLCVGTPQASHGLGADLSYVFGAVESLAGHLRPGSLVVGKSTVPVGTAVQLADILTTAHPDGSVALAWNPEFLREGFAVEDTLRPDRLVFGVEDDHSETVLREVYASAIAQGTPVVTTNFATAELVKVSANAFLATKISFINAIAEVCEATGGDVVALADALGHDQRIGRRFLNAGIGFGGGCLPKDIRGFLHRASELGVGEAIGFLREVDLINMRRRQRVVEVAREELVHVNDPTIAVLGAAFKPDSDDVRDSPALWIAGQLHLAGYDVRVFDPHAMETSRQVFPRLTYVDGVDAACSGAHLTLLLTEWPEFRDLDPEVLRDSVAIRSIFDGRNVLDPQRWRDAGWRYRGVGRP